MWCSNCNLPSSCCHEYIEKSNASSKLTSLYIPGETTERPLMLLILHILIILAHKNVLSLRFQSLGLAYGGDVFYYKNQMLFSYSSSSFANFMKERLTHNLKLRKYLIMLPFIENNGHHRKFEII